MKIRWMFLVVAMDFVSEQLLFFFTLESISQIIYVTAMIKK